MEGCNGKDTDCHAQSPGQTVRGVWRGNGYIDLHFVFEGSSARCHEPFDCTNVVDYSNGGHIYPFTLAGLKAALNAWKADLYEGELRDYRENVSIAAGGRY